METQSLNTKKLLGNFFVMFVGLVILQIYYATVILTYKPVTVTSAAFLAVFHCEVFLLLWCFAKAMFTDPGHVPRYWGFYMGDSEMKRRRYCLMCHVFKPERCHHCSSCNRCVLNMDHHCPWINNCVGFYNRKFFMLLLFYVILCTYTVDIALFPAAYRAVVELHEIGALELWPRAFLLCTYSLNVSLSVVMTMFLRFHVGLVFLNKTTIDTMDKKNLQQRGDVRGRQFNISPRFNFEQVFGRDPWFWLVPATGLSGKPVGDGVHWKISVNSFAEDDVPNNEVEGRLGGHMGVSGNVSSPSSRVQFQTISSPRLQKPVATKGDL